MGFTLLDEPFDYAGSGGRLSTGVTEALFAFVIVAPLLFVPQLGPLAPAASFAFTLFYGATRPPAVRAALLSRWPLLLVPAYAFLSLLWSAYPGVTLKHSVELLLTVSGGLLLSASLAPAGALAGTWAAFAMFMLVSFALGGSVDVGSSPTGGPSGQSAFSGLNGVKNLFGMMGGLSVLTSLFMAARAVERRRWLILLWATGLLLVELYLTFIARSAGALIALAVGGGVMIGFGILTRFKPGHRLVVAGLVLLLAAAVSVLVYAEADNAANAALNLFHKDPTLTGRSYLWYRAQDYIGERPWFGRGFDAFWVQSNPDAEGLWQFGQVAQQAGFNFHNTLIEFLIHFGWIGTVLTLAVYGYSFYRLLLRALRDADAVAGFYLGLIAFQLARSPVESLMPSAVDFATVLAFAALGYGYGAPRREVVLERQLSGPRRRSQAPRQPRLGVANRLGS